MNSDIKLISGRVKKTAAGQTPADRYEFLRLNDTEPDLGVPPVDDSVAASLVDGTRKWLTFSDGLFVDNDIVTVDENTVFIDTTGFNFSASDSLADVLADLDSNLASATEGTLTVVVSDNTLEGAGTSESPLSVVKVPNGLIAGDGIDGSTFDGSSEVTFSIDSTVVRTSDNQTVEGIKTFADPVDVNGTRLVTQTQTLSTTTFSQIALFDVSNTAKVLVSAVRGNDKQISELLITNDGTDAYATEYGVVTTNDVLFTIDVDISGSDVRILAEGTDAASTVYTSFLTLIGV